MTAATPNDFLFIEDAVRAALRDQMGDARQRAKARHVFPWWESDDAYTIFRGQLNEQVMLVPFARLCEAAELVLGRNVQPYEFLNPQKLLTELQELMP